MLKANEMNDFAEYRTRWLVLATWDIPIRMTLPELELDFFAIFVNN